MVFIELGVLGVRLQDLQDLTGLLNSYLGVLLHPAESGVLWCNRMIGRAQGERLIFL